MKSRPRSMFSKSRAGDVLANRHRPRRERELRVVGRRQFELRALNRLVQLVAELVLDQQQKRLEPLGRRRGALACAPASPASAAISGTTDSASARAARTGQLGTGRNLFGGDRYRRPCPSRGATRLRMIRLSNASPAIGTPSVPMMSDACRPPPPHAGSDRDDREVAGAAAEVADQNALVVLEARLVGVGGRHRFVLEDDLFEAGEPDRGQQPLGAKASNRHRADWKSGPVSRARSTRRRPGRCTRARSPMCLPINAISFRASSAACRCRCLRTSGRRGRP